MLAEIFTPEQITILTQIIFFLLSGSNFDATIPIIIALSPAKTRSINIICIKIINSSVIEFDYLK